MSNVSEKHHGINVLATGNEASKTKWSDPASGQKQYAGWHADGLKKFKELLEAVVGAPNTGYYPLGFVTTPQNAFRTLPEKQSMPLQLAQ